MCCAPLDRESECTTNASPSRYDGHDPAINALDDKAIATDKAAYLPGSGQATFAKLDTLPIASIAVLNGYAFGGGLELARLTRLHVVPLLPEVLEDSGLGDLPLERLECPVQPVALFEMNLDHQYPFPG